MKKLIGVFICLILISGCSKDITGKYYGTIHGGSYLELNKDGTFMVFENMKGTTGKYEIKGEEIILNFDSGMDEKCVFKDGKIFDGDREIYVKREK